MRDEVERYGGLEEEDLGERLKSLRTLDTAIYGWFDAHPMEDLDADPTASMLRSLMKESAKEHAEVVAVIMTEHRDGSILPIDVTGMQKTEVEKIKNLWTSLLEQSGQLKVDRKNESFAKNIWGQLAKLLQTRTGQDIIGYLNAPPKEGEKPKDVIIVPELPEDLKQKTESESSYAAATPQLRDENYRGHEFTADTVVNNSYPGVDEPEDLTTVILGGAKGIKLQDKSHTFGEGSGSYVKINLDEGPSEHKMAGTQGNEVIDPTFVGTLGHELGHAMKMKAGALAPNSDSSVLGAFESNAEEQKLWSNRGEEYININAVENKIRQEHGVPERKYHKPLGSVHASQRAKWLANEYGRLAAETLQPTDIPAYVQALGLFTRRTTELSDPDEFDQRKQQLALLGPRLAAQGVTDWKTAAVNAELRRYQSSVNNSQLVPQMAGWRRIKSQLATKKGTITAPNNTDLNDFKRFVTKEINVIPAERKDGMKALARVEKSRKAEAKSLRKITSKSSK